MTSINVVLLLHTHSLSGQRGAGIFYSEQSALARLQTAVKEGSGGAGAGSEAEGGLF